MTPKLLQKFAMEFLLLGMAASALGQGLVFFNNRVTSVGMYAPVYGLNPANPSWVLQGNSFTNGGAVDYTGCPLLLGTGYTAALYAGPAGITDWYDTNLQLVAVAAFRTNATLAGIVQVTSTAVVVSNVPQGQQATFQMRAWDNCGGEVKSWDQVMRCGYIPRGMSALLTSPPLGGTNPPAIGATLVGLTSFNFFVPLSGYNSITRQAQSVALSAGGSTKLSVEICSCEGAAVEWRLRGTNAPATSVGSCFGTATLSLTNVTFETTGEYSAVVTFSNCWPTSTTSSSAVVTVPPRFVGIQSVSSELVELNYDAPPGLPLTLEMRPSVTGSNWITLGTITNQAVRGQFFDAAATNQLRFYRLRL